MCSSVLLLVAVCASVTERNSVKPTIVEETPGENFSSERHDKTIADVKS